MKVQINIVGVVDHHRRVEWPEGWPVPRVGDETEIPGIPEASEVRTVVWYPEGDESNDEPFVYLVIGRPRMR